MRDTYQMMVCGVGGQGILTITDIIVMAAQDKGLRVLGSEVHGMAQKGGSVVTNLKIGKELHSPVTPIGSCKVLVGLEQNVDELHFDRFGRTVDYAYIVRFDQSLTSIRFNGLTGWHTQIEGTEQ